MTVPAASTALLEALRGRNPPIPPERVDQVWLFPPRAVGAAESSIAVLSLFAEDKPVDRREILTLHCLVTTVRGRASRSDELREHGSAPADRVERVIRGVANRLRTDPEMPRSEDILGDPDRWQALLAGTAVPT